MKAKLSSVTDLYKFPKYYDILFGWERSDEIFFWEKLFEKYKIDHKREILEIACGTGTVSISLALLGWKLKGLDSYSEMLGYLQKKAKDANVFVDTVHADMKEFKLEEPVAVAFCPLGSIGLLKNDEELIQHFISISKNLEERGYYFVDIGLTEGDTQLFDYEWVEWSSEKDGVVVETKNGIIQVEDSEKEDKTTLTWDLVPLEFNLEHFKSLIKVAGVFEISGWYSEHAQTLDGISLFDIDYVHSEPISERTIVVLRKI